MRRLNQATRIRRVGQSDSDKATRTKRLGQDNSDKTTRTRQLGRGADSGRPRRLGPSPSSTRSESAGRRDPSLRAGSDRGAAAPLTRQAANAPCASGGPLRPPLRPRRAQMRSAPHPSPFLARRPAPGAGALVCVWGGGCAPPPRPHDRRAPGDGGDVSEHAPPRRAWAPQERVPHGTKRRPTNKKKINNNNNK